MKKSLFLYLFIFCVQIVCAETELSLRKYFQENILELDPIEGIYDVQWLMRYVTPYVNQTENDHFTYYIKETYKGSGKFSLYVKEQGSFHQSYNCKISRIGESSAYYFYYQSSQARFVLENESRFRAVVPLDHSSAKKVTGNPNLHPTLVKITLIYECIKTFPTSSMYLEAAKEDARKAEQEYQKALEEAQKRAGWSGSGFALNQGHIVTNYHVIEDAKTILIKGVKGDFQTELRAKVVATDKINDIAILKIDDERFKGFGAIPYKVKREMSDVGESVWALGYPMVGVMGDEVKFTDGKISARTGIQGDMSVYQISVPIQPGNSGGPLFDNNGNIVGITSSGLNREAFYSENVNYAIKTSYLYNLIESSMSASILPQGTAMQGQSLTEKIKLAKKFVYIILCSEDPNFHNEKLRAQNTARKTPSLQSQPSSSDKTSNNTKRSVDSKGIVTIDNPLQREGSMLKVRGITINNHETIICCSFTNSNYKEFGINKNAYILCNNTQRYRLRYPLSIPILPETEEVTLNQEIQFTLVFEAIPSNSESIDIFIDNYLNAYNIQLK